MKNDIDLETAKVLNDLSAIKVECTSVHKGCMAPKGHIFLIGTLSHNKMIYTKRLMIDRSSVKDEQMDDVKNIFRKNFMDEVNKKINR